MVLARNALGIFAKYAKLDMMPKTPKAGAHPFTLLGAP
jgi:hypothetical protein